MADYQLTNPYPVDNPRRLEIADVVEERSIRNDPNSVVALRVSIEFRSAAASDREYGTYILTIRNGNSSQLRPRAVYPAGMVLQDMLEVVEISTPTGLNTALAAWRGGSATGSGAGNRRKALAQAMKDLDVIAQGGGSGALAGAVP